MLRLRQAAVFGAIVSVLVASTAVRAQNPLAQLALSREDLQMQGEAVKSLYDARKIGVTQSWSNPKSGNSGSVRILDLFEYRGLPCRTVAYMVKIKGEADPMQATLESCRDKDGIWKLV